MLLSTHAHWHWWCLVNACVCTIAYRSWFVYNAFGLLLYTLCVCVCYATATNAGISAAVLRLFRLCRPASVTVVYSQACCYTNKFFPIQNMFSGLFLLTKASLFAAAVGFHSQVPTPPSPCLIACHQTQHCLRSRLDRDPGKRELRLRSRFGRVQQPQFHSTQHRQWLFACRLPIWFAARGREAVAAAVTQQQQH